MTTYNTGNPLGSVDVRDLYDNAQNTDLLTSGTSPTYPDRLGAPRKSYRGMENDFQVLIDSSVLVSLGDYAAGIQFTARNQYMVRSGAAYRLSLSTALPYTTTGTWPGSDDNNFSAVDFDQPENSIKRYGATGTGGDDLAAINNAIAAVGAGELYASQNTRFIVSAKPTNPNGVDFAGGGNIALPENGGVYQLSTQFDKGQSIGVEYLYRAWSFIQTQDGDRSAAPSGGPSSNLNVFLYGDSTAVGFVATSGPTPVTNLPSYLLPNNALKAQLNNNGVRYVTVTQRAVSGTSWRDLDAIPDLGATTSLLVIKYGINDAVFTTGGVIAPGAPVRSRIAELATTMRAKLAAIRAAANGALSQVSIILVGPTATVDSVNGRNEEWYEQVRNVYVKAARDYQCCYVDPYQYMRDARTGGLLWMDQPYGGTEAGNTGPRTVHMRESAMAPLWAWIVDQTFPKEALLEWGAAGFRNIGSNGAAEVANSATGPIGYRAGVTWQKATIAGGFPKEGWLKTERFADGHARQTLTPSGAINSDNAAITRGTAAALTTWHPRWTGVAENITFLSGWADFAASTPAPSASIDDQGYVQAQGSVKNGTITAGASIAALPAGMRPASTLYFPVSTNSGTGSVSVDSTGAIKIVAGGDAARMSLDSIRFKADPL